MKYLWSKHWIEDNNLGSLLTINNLKSIKNDNQLTRELNKVLQTDGLYRIIEEYLSPLSRELHLKITRITSEDVTAIYIGAVQECTSSNGTGLKICINPDKAYIDLDMNGIILFYITYTSNEWNEIEAIHEFMNSISITCT